MAAVKEKRVPLFQRARSSRPLLLIALVYVGGVLLSWLSGILANSEEVPLQTSGYVIGIFVAFLPPFLLAHLARPALNALEKYLAAWIINSGAVFVGVALIFGFYVWLLGWNVGWA